jgi:hypothetical protein
MNSENESFYNRYIPHLSPVIFLNIALSFSEAHTFNVFSSTFSSEWIEKCLQVWDSVPNCQFWNDQWVSIFARCMKHCTSINWEAFHERLFTHYLNMFEVRVFKY